MMFPRTFMSNAIRGVTLPSVMRTPASVMGAFPSASFAKYDRSKPHLNVGTIGK
jgi:hypothetical protein